nr:MAG TPA: hypothetical protein [Inoviridae sp.]
MYSSLLPNTLTSVFRVMVRHTIFTILQIVNPIIVAIPT